MNYEVPRRLFLKSTLSAIAAATCSPKIEPDSEQNSRSNEEAIFKAGALTLMIGGQKTAQVFLMEDHGQYAFYTIAHAANALLEHRSNARIVCLGLLDIKIGPQMFMYEPVKNDIDPSAKYFVDDLPNKEDSLAILQMIGGKKLVPLVPAQRPPAKDERVAIPDPDSGNLTIMYAGDYADHENMLYIVSNGTSTICRGRSGAPVLRCNGDTLTNEIYGIVSKSFLGHPTNDCGFRASFRPIDRTTITIHQF